MRAIVITRFGGPEVLAIQTLPIPEPKLGYVLIQVKAFGINHAETHMRKGEWAESMPVSGIECVGIVKACPGGEFEEGTKVAAFMGGLGRTINGSYAEYTLAPASNVVKMGTNLDWSTLAALPESFATAWTFLFRNLEVQEGQTLLVRGATSALGQAAVKLAVGTGVKVFATTRSEARFQELKDMGVSEVLTEQHNLPDQLHALPPIDAVLNLVGNSVLLESMTIPRRGGRVCLGGFLGGLDPIKEFNPLLQMPSGVHFSFFGSFHFGLPAFPVSDVPLATIADDVERGNLKVQPAKVFRFGEIAEAHKLMESSQANGKIVVVV